MLWALAAGFGVDAGLQEDNSKVRKIPVSVSDDEIDDNEVILSIGQLRSHSLSSVSSNPVPFSPSPASLVRETCGNDRL